MVNQADVIVRAIAEKYDVVPKNPNLMTTGVPDSKVRFEVLEVIRGKTLANLTLPAYCSYGSSWPPSTALIRSQNLGQPSWQASGPD